MGEITFITEHSYQGYAINKNNLFLMFMARKLETSGRVNEAKDYYQKIINEEPEDSYISIRAKKELKSSCFIATLVYGNKYAPEVEALRLIRDRYMTNRLCRPLIKVYYRYSPKVTERLQRRPGLIKLVKFMLNVLLSVFWKLRVLMR